MPTRRPVHVDDNATTIRETNRFLKMPHSQPKTDEHHAANVRELERWGNRIPYNTGDGDDGCCSCWHFLPFSTAAVEGDFSINYPTDTVSTYTPSPAVEAETTGLMFHMKYSFEIPNEATPGYYYTFEVTASGVGNGYYTQRRLDPLYAPNNASGVTTVEGDIIMHVYPFVGSSLDVYFLMNYFDDTGASATLPTIAAYIEAWNRTNCYWYQEPNES